MAAVTAPKATTEITAEPKKPAAKAPKAPKNELNKG